MNILQSQVRKSPLCRWPRSLLPALALLAASGLLAGCGQQTPPPPPPPEVTVAQPIRRTVANYYIFTGSTRAIEAAEIRARVAGILEKITFEPSSFVQEGDLLFVIERARYKAARDEAFAALKSTEAELKRAESDLERINHAIATKAVSEQDLDRAVAQKNQAEAAVLAAKAQLAQAELDYSYTLVRSPINGQVSRNFVDAGNLVGQGESTLLTTVNKMNPIFVYFDVPERHILRLMRNRQETIAAGDSTGGTTEAFVALADEEGFPHRGVIDYIDNTINPATGTMQVRAVVPNDDHLIFPGFFVQIKIRDRKALDAVLVDERAVGTDLGGKYVYVVGNDNVVEQRFVQLGQLQPDGMVVVTEGLNSSETYIVNGVLRARPGLPVTPKAAAVAGASAEGR